MKRKDMQGQMSIFDLLKTKEKNTIPIVFHDADRIFVVNKADVRVAIVQAEKPWVVHEGTSYGYRIKYIGGCYGVIFNTSLNQNVFFSEEAAKEVAEKYVKNHEMFLAEDIKSRIQSIDAYVYNRDLDNYAVRAYMAEIDGGLLYIKNFCTYQHIVADTPKNRKEFAMQIEEAKKNHPNLVKTEEIEIVNMYPCQHQGGGGWLYAESNYMGCI